MYKELVDWRWDKASWRCRDSSSARRSTPALPRASFKVAISLVSRFELWAWAVATAAGVWAATTGVGGAGVVATENDVLVVTGADECTWAAVAAACCCCWVL